MNGVALEFSNFVKFVRNEECTEQANAKKNLQRFATNIFSDCIMPSVADESIGYGVFCI